MDPVNKGEEGTEENKGDKDINESRPHGHRRVPQHAMTYLLATVIKRTTLMVQGAMCNL